MKLVKQKETIAEQNEKIKTMERHIEELKAAYAELEDQQRINDEKAEQRYNEECKKRNGDQQNY